MFCPNCGSELLPGTTFCSDCGSELSELANIVPESKRDNTSSPINNQSQININQLPQDPFKMQNMHNNLHNINQIPNNNITGMPLQQPNQMNNMQMGNIPMKNPMHIMPMGMPMPPNQMVNMGMPMQQMPNQPININIMQVPPKKKKKNKLLAAFFAFIFGGLGIHKFYLGKYGWGILYPLFTFFTFIIALEADSPTLGLLSTLPAFVSFIEGLMYIFMSNEDFQKKY